jgi:hypothetical protein
MSSTKRLSVGAASVVTLIACAQWVPATAQAAEELHNVTYLARVTGVARGAEITYKINDTQVDSANPTMIPGRTFEADAVLADPKQAGMQVSIQWPYSASLHCEIQVDGETVAEANQFIAPRVTPDTDDPLYGVLPCGAALNNAPGNVVNTDPLAGSTPPDAPAPADPAPPVDDGPPADS